MKAKYRGKKKYYATITFIFGDFALVDWDDGDPSHRWVPTRDVYKDNKKCELLGGVRTVCRVCC